MVDVTDDVDKAPCSHVLGLVAYFEANNLSLWGGEGKRRAPFTVHCRNCNKMYTLDPICEVNEAAYILLDELEDERK